MKEYHKREKELIEKVKKTIENCKRVIGIVEKELFVEVKLFGRPLTPFLFNSIKAYLIASAGPLLLGILKSIYLHFNP